MLFCNIFFSQELLRRGLLSQFIQLFVGKQKECWDQSAILSQMQGQKYGWNEILIEKAKIQRLSSINLPYCNKSKGFSFQNPQIYFLIRWQLSNMKTYKPAMKSFQTYNFYQTSIIEAIIHFFSSLFLFYCDFNTPNTQNTTQKIISLLDVCPHMKALDAANKTTLPA